jgi:hypothetical protein
LQLRSSFLLENQATAMLQAWISVEAGDPVLVADAPFPL